MKRLALYLCFGLAVSLVGAVSAGAQTASTFHKFSGGSAGDGDEPTVLIQAQDGNFYGITSYGGNSSGCTNDQGNSTGCGTIFRISSSGTETVLYKFPGAVGGTSANQYGGIPSSLVQGPDGNIYGTTIVGGLAQTPTLSCVDGSETVVPCCVDSNDNAVGCGTIFEFSPTQAASIMPNILYTFSGTTDGGAPGNLILGATGTTNSETPVIYGTTLSCSNCHASFSGSYFNAESGGTIFSLTPSGSTKVTPNTLATFPTSLNSDLALPNSLIQWDLNTLYGIAQMGGATSTGPNPVCTTEFGCGGVFRLELSSSTLLDLCNFGDIIGVVPPAVPTCSSAVMPQPASLSDPPKSSEKLSPQLIITQSGSRFPTGGSPWGFTPVPIALAMDSSGNIYGTTPPGCVDSSYSTPYQPDPNCVADHPNSSPSAVSVQSTIFEMTPPSETSNSAGKVTFLYTFSGNGSSAATPPTDGGGSIAGLTLASDGNFYGLSGDGASAFYGLSGTSDLSSEMFKLPVQSGSLPNYVSLGPSYSPNWMIQGSNGNFYGTSSTYFSGSTDQYGSVFEVAPATSLIPPVGLSLNASQITLGNSATLTWTVPYASSLTAQQCIAFVEGTNASTAGSWSGLQKGSVTSNVYGNSISITPTAPGSYTYALTCGGTVSGSATLQVIVPPLQFPTIALPTGVTNQTYTGSVAAQASGGVAPYTFTLASGSSLPPGLTLNSNGTFSSGPPTAVGSYTFSITVKDAETPAAAVTTSFTIVVMSQTPLVTLTAQPNTGVTYGQLVTLTGTETPVEGVAQGYSWTIFEDGSALVTGALSNGSGSYTMTTTPHAGQHTFSATFSSTQNYYPPGNSNTVSLTVAKATPTVSAWPVPGAITYGQTLANSTLNGGSASVGGSFTWTAPTIAPGAGTASESVTFTPTDTTDYNTVTGTVMVTVNKATPTVTAWPMASAITVGQTLASSTLSGGTASVGGAFSWTTPTTAPGVGSYSGSVTFTPTDTTDYNTVIGSVTVTVNAAPGFTLSPSPMSVSVAQGGSGTTTITVTDIGGFSGTVALAATGLPSGVTSSFASGTAPGTQVLTLMASTSAQVTSAPVTITVTGTSGALSAMTSVSLSITPQPSFTAGSGGTTSMSIVPGATTGNTGTISIAGTNGFSGTVNLSCNVTTSMTNVSDMPSCSLNPVSVNINGTPAQTSVLTVTTTAAIIAENSIKKLIWPTSGTTLALVVLFMVPRRRRSWFSMSVMILLYIVIGAVGCGGGSVGGGGGGGGNPGTTAGAYTITVTGTSGSVTATVGTVNVTVQ